MRIILDLPVSGTKQIEHWNGIFCSFFETVEEILSKKRRASYLTHFFLERLEKGERQEFLKCLSKVIPQLHQKSKENQTKVLASTQNGQDLEVLHNIIKSFRQGVSKSATISHQSLNGMGDSSRKGDEISKIIEEEILNVIKSRQG
jgi:SRSO17 transposase